jgi:hypothetical protein
MILPYPVTHVWMTARARQLFPALRTVFDRVGDRFVTIPTGFLRYFMIARRDAQRVWEPTRREVEGVPKPIACLDRVFTDPIVRRVAIIAYRNGAMTRFAPGI